MKQNGTGFLDLSTETAHDDTEKRHNGTRARVWQNGTVPCRLCRVPSCAVCAVPAAEDKTEAHKAKLATDPRFAGWVAGGKA